MARICRLLSVLVLAALAGAACGSDSPTAPGAALDIPYSQTDLTVGTGTQAVTGRRLSVHYTGWLYDPAKAGFKGQQFDSSANRGPFAFVLGAGQVIRGWDQGFTGMRVGGTRRLVIPPSLGYGPSGSGSIPGNATLIFDVELVDVQ